jgi:hypothetical protein
MRVAHGGAAGQAPPEAYDVFYAAVARRLLLDWLPSQPARILDLSGEPCITHILVEAGHQVIAAHRAGISGATEVVADPHTLTWLGDDTIDVVVAEGRALSLSLATEITIEHIARVLRPGGRLLLCVDSLRMGLAHLASHGRWAELADVPSADVVLIPEDDGTIFRCFWPEELGEVLAGAGLVVEWIRPRTVLASHAVESALGADPSHLDMLVTTELALSAEREGESLGHHLVASAHRPERSGAQP